MDYSSLLSTLNTDAAPTGGEPPKLPNFFNGAQLVIDIAKPKDHIQEKNKIVLAGNVLDAELTAVYRLYVALGKPADVGSVPAMTDDVLKGLVDNVTELVARSIIYGLAHAVGHAITVRNSDVARDLPSAPVLALLRRHVRRVYSYIDASDERRELVSEVGQMLGYAIVANGCHRKMFDGHSWFSDEMRDPGSVQCKLFAVAGRNSKKFGEFMKKQHVAHDLNHHLSDASLEFLALACAGKNNAHASPAIPGGAAAVGDIDYVYNGAAINEKPVGELLHLGEAAANRYPPNQMGKAALIVGLEYTAAMIADLCQIAKVEGAEHLEGNIEALNAAITADTFPIYMLKDMDRLLGKIVAISCGYCITRRLYTEGDAKAFETHSGRYKAKVATGKALALAVAELTPHEEAMTGRIASIISTVASAITSAAAMSYGPPDLRTPIATITSIKIDAIKVAVGKDPQDKMVQMISAMRGGDVFSDAQA